MRRRQAFAEKKEKVIPKEIPIVEKKPRGRPKAK